MNCGDLNYCVFLNPILSVPYFGFAFFSRYSPFTKVHSFDTRADKMQATYNKPEAACPTL